MLTHLSKPRWRMMTSSNGNIFRVTYWTFVRGIHRWPVNSAHKAQLRGALMFSLISAWTNGSVNNRYAGDLRRHRVHFDVPVFGNPASVYTIREDDALNEFAHTGILWDTCIDDLASGASHYIYNLSQCWPSSPIHISIVRSSAGNSFYIKALCH